MQITETLNEGLKREIKVVVPKTDLAQKMNERLANAKDRIKLNGFRPGKVPLSYLKQTYGRSFMAEVVNEILNEAPKNVLADRGEKAAMTPRVEMSEDEKEAEKVLAGEQDFEFTLNYEVVPAFEIKDLSALKIEREVVEVPETEIDEQVRNVAKSAQTYAEKKGKAADGDRVTMDYLGKVDGVAFDGGAAEDATLVLGSGQFIPGFEDQLVGAKAGDSKIITVTFPDPYGAEHLAGKEATFDITVKKVEAPEELVINDETAKALGLTDLEHLKKVVRDQIENQFGSITRQRVKRKLLDLLDGEYKFETPQGMVEAEFNNIWTQVSMELQQAGKTFEDEDTTEEKAREEYTTLAERRVRLGLVLSAIGEEAGIVVTDEETQRALYDQVRQYRGQEQQVLEYFQKNPDAIAGLRAPIFEEKVVDHILGKINVTDKSVTKEEIMALEAAEEEGAEEAKPAKKAPAKKKAKKDE